jgi:hypothetical protein
LWRTTAKAADILLMEVDEISQRRDQDRFENTFPRYSQSSTFKISSQTLLTTAVLAVSTDSQRSSQQQGL